MHDILLRKGTVVDGTGAPAFTADVAISGGRIATIGELTNASADLVLDLAGLTVAPGFIDCHSHSEMDLLADPLAGPKVGQGVTTEVVCNCGWGPFPARSEHAQEAMAALLPTSAAEGVGHLFDSLRDYRGALQSRAPAVNVAALIPHGPVRLSIVGSEDRAAAQSEIAAMQALVRECYEDGAIGMSLGLLYAPGCFTPAEEIASLATALAGPRRLVFHVRNECDRFAESIEEAIAIGRRAKAHVHISHLKVADPAHWGRIGAALAQIEDAGRRGQSVTCDQYPYTAGSSPLQTLLPPWSLAGGTGQLLARLRDRGARKRMAAALAGEEQIAGWDNLSLRIGWGRIAVGYASGAQQWEGETLEAIAGRAGRPPWEILFDLLALSRGAAVGIYHQMCEEDVRAVIVHPTQMVGSDGLPAPGKPHPRLWGTFPRVLGRYCRELGLLSLEEAVRKMSGKTAETFGLRGRGLLRPGYHADLCVFDSAQVADAATYDDPAQPPRGIVHVICNGLPTMLDGERTRHRPGRWLN